MATINKNYKTLQAGYLFSEIAKRTKVFLEKNKDAKVLRLGIGNTTEALPKSVIDGLGLGVSKLANVDTYTGYGDEQGDTRLRAALSTWYKNMGVRIDPLEIFVSDGAKTDSANISSIFGNDNVVAVSDPVYPVYVDSNVIQGRGGEFKNGRYKNIVYLDSLEENGFFPKLPDKKVDLIYICSPNNPTGAVATRDQLKRFVNWALKHKAIIIFDAAYSFFIKDKNLPRSIYEIPGARKCAIEISSFSKWAGFTGVRLGWTIVPMDLITQNSKKGELNAMWNRRQTTMFNGASNIAQEGGLAVLSKKGQRESGEIIDYYMENARLIRVGLEKMGLKVFGGKNAPYIWLKTPNGLSSWEFFDKLLNEARVVGTPGAGFGLLGEGYFRLSAFGHRENVKQAIKSIQENLKI
ncbi:MAG: LL-diaminopimelate aminotransferase [Candidatus Levybacteria bacterium]|nr:LL-diaminopimelate aminotransferase [Candidatus Levybacteria bacterium]